MERVLIIVCLVLQVIILVSLIFLFIRKKGASVKIDQDDLKNSLNKNLSSEILDFSQRLSKQLIDNVQSSNEMMTRFRVDVNKELDEFKIKLNDKLQDEFKKLGETVDSKMTNINEKVELRLSKGFESTNETFDKIKASMVVMEQAQAKIEGLSTEMIGLQNILTNNQQRGAFGEYQLGQILYATFGENSKLYALQYQIREESAKKESVRADAAIFMPQGIICIDSKFPYSHYAQLFDRNKKDDEKLILRKLKEDVEKHIKDISEKYIVPGKTMDFALMFLPSDGILALLHDKLPELIEEARQKGVTIVSPTVIIPLLASFKIMDYDYKMSQYASEIRKGLISLSIEFSRFDDRWMKLVNTINSLSDKTNEVNITVRKITNKFSSMKSIETPEEIVKINEDKE